MMFAEGGAIDAIKTRQGGGLAAWPPPIIDLSGFALRWNSLTSDASRS